MNSNNSEDFSYQTLELLPIGVFILRLISRDDMEFMNVYVNKKNSEIVGVDLQPFMGKTLRETFPEAYNNKFPEYYLQALDSQEKVTIGDVEYGDENINKELYFLEVIPLDEKTVMLISENRTELKRNIEKTEISRQFLDQIINSMSDPVFVKDDQSRLILVNDVFCDMFNLPRIDVIGKTLAENVPSDEREHFLRIDKAVIESGIDSLIEESLTVDGGDSLTILTNKTRFIDQNGIRFLIGIIHDITNFKKIERELITAKESAEEGGEKLNEAQTLSQVGSWKWNCLTNEVEWSDMMFKILGYEPKEVEGSYELALSHVHKDDKHKYEKTLEASMTNKTTYYLENRICKKDGTVVPVVSRGICVLDKNKTIIGMSGTVQDVSAMKIVQNDLHAMNSSLELRIQKSITELVDALEREKEANELKSKFVSMASHEFRTPLTTIKNCTRLIDKYKTTEQQEERIRHTKRIRSSVQTLTSILNDFLTFGKLEKGGLVVNRKEIDIKELVSSSITDFEGSTKKGQLIHYSHEGETLISTDNNLIQGIIQNLLSNAIKFSDKDIDLNTKVSNGELMLSVKDSGIGIPQEEQENIFNRFFRAGNSTNIQGTGLGLNIVKQYVELLGGNVDFISQHDNGTTFSVMIPAHNQ